MVDVFSGVSLDLSRVINHWWLRINCDVQMAHVNMVKETPMDKGYCYLNGVLVHFTLTYSALTYNSCSM